MTAVPETHQLASSVIARIDRLPVVSRLHRGWIGLLAIVFGFELSDLNTFALAAPTLRQEWGLSVTEIGWATSAAFVGMFVGALTGGTIADRFGRKPTLVTAGLCFSAFSLLSATANGIGEMIVYRVLTGLGMEAMTVAALAFVTEMFPKALRGRYQALLLGLGVIGIPVMSWFSKFVLPLGHNGWRWIFVFGALGAACSFAMVKMLPESVPWLAMHGQTDRANAILTRMETAVEHRIAGPLPEPDQIRVTLEKPRFYRLFAREHRRSTVVMSIAWICSILGFYGFNSWTATLLDMRNFDAGNSVTYTAIVTIGSVPGALTAWFISDRFQRRYALLTVNLIVAALVLLYGSVDNVGVVLVAGFFVTFFLQCQTALLYAYTPEAFPTNLRAVGTGLTNGLGRLAGVAGGVIVASVYGQLGLSMVFVYVAAALCLGGLVLGLFGPRTNAHWETTGVPASTHATDGTVQ